MDPKGHVQPLTMGADSKGYLGQHLLMNLEHTPSGSDSGKGIYLTQLFQLLSTVTQTRTC